MKANLLKYRGYLGAVEFDARDSVLRGRVVNIDDIVTFQAPDAASVAAEFRASVDDYLEQCAELGQDPDRPASGRVTVRMKPQTHRALLAHAKAHHRSLNRQITKILDRAATRVGIDVASGVEPVEARPARAAVPPGKPKAAVEAGKPKPRSKAKSS